MSALDGDVWPAALSLGKQPASTGYEAGIGHTVGLEVLPVSDKCRLLYSMGMERERGMRAFPFSLSHDASGSIIMRRWVIAIKQRQSTVRRYLSYWHCEDNSYGSQYGIINPDQTSEKIRDLDPLCRASTVAEIRYAMEFVLQHFKDLYLLVYPSIRQTLDRFMLNPRLLIFVSTLKEIHLFNVQARLIYLPRKVQSVPWLVYGLTTPIWFPPSELIFV